MPDHYLLQWSNHLTNIASAFTSLRQNNKLVDVTLAADGRSLEAHKVVLCACSAYFEVRTPSKRAGLHFLSEKKVIA